MSEQQNTGFFGRLFGNRNPRPQRPLPPRNVGQALNRNVGSTPTARPPVSAPTSDPNKTLPGSAPRLGSNLTPRAPATAPASVSRPPRRPEPANQRPLPPRNVGQALNRNVGSTPTAGPNAGQVPSTVSRENQMPANRAQNTAFNPAEVARQRVMSRQRADDVDTASKSSVAMNRRVPAPATPSSSTATTTPRNRFQQPASTVASAADRAAFRSRTGSTVGASQAELRQKADDRDSADMASQAANREAPASAPTPASVPMPPRRPRPQATPQQAAPEPKSRQMFQAATDSNDDSAASFFAADRQLSKERGLRESIIKKMNEKKNEKALGKTATGKPGEVIDTDPDKAELSGQPR